MSSFEYKIRKYLFNYCVSNLPLSFSLFSEADLEKIGQPANAVDTYLNGAVV